MIPKRYLIATLFIAAMLVMLAVVQAPKSTQEGGVIAAPQATALVLESFETLAEYRLQDQWAPRFQGTQDPDQPEPWPFSGGFGAPWEPASPYLADQGLALNGPGGRSEVLLWRGLEWRHYPFNAPISSARLDPMKGNRLLVTLMLGPSRFETRLLEVPEGRVLWASDSGPWSRFSWDGKAVLLGLKAPSPEEALLLTALPTDGNVPPQTLAAWDEKGLPGPPKNWSVKPEQLWDDGKDLVGARLLVPWRNGYHMWFASQDRLWISDRGGWTLWGLQKDGWRRLESDSGVLAAHPPVAMGRVSVDRDDKFVRQTSALEGGEWKTLAEDAKPWPAYDPAWFWLNEEAVTAWDLHWGKEPASFLPERQRETLVRSFKPEWRVASGLRASVPGWLPDGPEVALREIQGVAWVWVGDRVRLVRLQPAERLRQIKARLRLK